MLNPYTILRQLILQAFSEAEIKDIYFDYGVEYSDVAGTTRPEKVIALIKQLGRTGRLNNFVEWAKNARPDKDWPDTNWYTFDWLADQPEPVTVDPNIAPYKGLAYFDYTSEDIRRFFGREMLITELVQEVQDNIKDPSEANFLAIIGASGSGKSSLVRAGVVPELMGESGFQLHIVTPTDRPLETLAASLTRDSESVTATTTLIDNLQADRRSLHLYVRKLLAQQNNSERKLLLVIDQFEELFTLCDDEQKQAMFIDNLITAVSPKTGGSTVVLLTIRADFYHYCAPFNTLRELLSQQQKYIGNMDLQELRRAIINPATQVGYELEAGLAEQILRDVRGEPGSLPLLSHVLQEVWKRRDGLKLTLGGYAEAGGIEGAIAQTAEIVYTKKLSRPQQLLAKHIFLELTELGNETLDTRRRITHEHLQYKDIESSNLHDVLELLIQSRLITSNRSEYDRSIAYQVAHEALIREWPRLHSWLEESREDLRFKRHLSADARRWLKENQKPEYLYRGSRLDRAFEWQLHNQHLLTNLDMAFLESSQSLREREKAERDAIRLKEIEQEATSERLREFDRRKSKFLIDLSHELRTPINSIIGFTDVLLEEIDGKLNTRMREDILLIRDGGQHIRAIIGDLSDLSRIEIGRMYLTYGNVELPRIAHEVMATTQGLTADKPIELILDIDETIGSIEADRTRLVQILLNILSNAAKFTNEGNITLSVQLQNDKFILFGVKDTGVGIEPKNMDLVFESFTQIKGIEHHKRGGTGLGLSLTKQLVEMHGGTIWLESIFGEGTTFWFTLPIERPQDSNKPI